MRPAAGKYEKDWNEAGDRQIIQRFDTWHRAAWIRWALGPGHVRSFAGSFVPRPRAVLYYWTMGKAAPPPFGRWAKSGSGSFFNVLEFEFCLLLYCLIVFRCFHDVWWLFRYVYMFCDFVFFAVLLFQRILNAFKYLLGCLWCSWIRCCCFVIVRCF